MESCTQISTYLAFLFQKIPDKIISKVVVLSEVANKFLVEVFGKETTQKILEEFTAEVQTLALGKKFLPWETFLNFVEVFSKSLLKYYFMEFQRYKVDDAEFYSYLYWKIFVIFVIFVTTTRNWRDEANAGATDNSLFPKFLILIALLR